MHTKYRIEKTATNNVYKSYMTIICFIDYLIHNQQYKHNNDKFINISFLILVILIQLILLLE